MTAPKNAPLTRDARVGEVAAAAGAPGEIRRLSEAVATMIAAGEVVQRPASALKEVLENALDAGASQVSVLAKDGGVKLLQVQDNGCGIRAEDLGILCHRHTTSKLREFDDLRQMRTLGFRGEALASVSFVSHLQVTTMTAGAESALRASYRDGELDDVGPQPCAGVPGTTITMKDLFYNLLARRKALRPPAEEYAKLLEVVSRYAVYKDGVAFSCRRQGAARPDVNVPARATRLDRIRTIYGPSVSRELTEFEAASEPGHCAGANGEAGSGLGGGGGGGGGGEGGEGSLLVLVPGFHFVGELHGKADDSDPFHQRQAGGVIPSAPRPGGGVCHGDA